MKICNECQYLSGGTFCHAPQNGISPVDGMPKSRFAIISRNDENLCGTNGNYWVQKKEEVKPWWRFWT